MVEVLGYFSSVLLSRYFKSIQLFSPAFYIFPGYIVKSVYFCKQLRIPWIETQTIVSFQVNNILEPLYVAYKFEVKWWAKFEICKHQIFDSVKAWINTHNFLSQPKPIPLALVNLGPTNPIVLLAYNIAPMDPMFKEDPPSFLPNKRPSKSIWIK